MVLLWAHRFLPTITLPGGVTPLMIGECVEQDNWIKRVTEMDKQNTKVFLKRKKKAKKTDPKMRSFTKIVNCFVLSWPVVTGLIWPQVQMSFIGSKIRFCFNYCKSPIFAIRHPTPNLVLTYNFLYAVLLNYVYLVLAELARINIDGILIRP